MYGIHPTDCVITEFKHYHSAVERIIDAMSKYHDVYLHMIRYRSAYAEIFDALSALSVDLEASTRIVSFGGVQLIVEAMDNLLRYPGWILQAGYSRISTLVIITG